MSYMQDPNMEAARLKIIAVLKEHDLMGSVMIASPGRSGFFNELSPSWSCAKVEVDAGGRMGFRIRAKREDFASAEAQEICVTQTVGGIMGLFQVYRYIGEMLTSVITLLGRHMSIQSVATDMRVQNLSEIPDGKEQRGND